MGDNLRDRRRDVWHLVLSDTSCGFLFYSISGILSIPLLVLHSGCMAVCVQYKHVQYVSMRACVNGASVRERHECAGERGCANLRCRCCLGAKQGRSHRLSQRRHGLAPGSCRRWMVLSLSARWSTRRESVIQDGVDLGHAGWLSGVEVSSGPAAAGKMYVRRSCIRDRAIWSGLVWSGLGVGIIILVGFSHSAPLMRQMP